MPDNPKAVLQLRKYNQIYPEVGGPSAQPTRIHERFASGGKERPWPPISSTLRLASRDAVLVDSYYGEQARRLDKGGGERQASNDDIRHTGNGAHFLAPVRFWSDSRARFVRAARCDKVMRQQASPESLADVLNPRVPANFSRLANRRRVKLATS